MKPKEKAEEIFKNYVIIHNRWVKNEYTMSKSIEQLKKELFNNQWFAPKEMALLTVNEIIDVIEFMAESDEPNKLPFWLDVRHELTKL